MIVRVSPACLTSWRLCERKILKIIKDSTCISMCGNMREQHVYIFCVGYSVPPKPENSGAGALYAHAFQFAYQY